MQKKSLQYFTQKIGGLSLVGLILSSLLLSDFSKGAVSLGLQTEEKETVFG